MGAPSHRNQARFVHLLLDDGHVSRRLHDFVVVAVAGGHARQRSANNTARVKLGVLRPVVGSACRTRIPRPPLGCDTFLPLRRQRRNLPVGRIIDKRRASVGPSALPPEGVISAVNVLICARLIPPARADGGLLVLLRPPLL